MEKYELLPEQLIHEGTISESNLFAPSLLDEASILRVHDEEYWLKLKEQRLSRKEERRTGFPLSQQLVEREIRIRKVRKSIPRFSITFLLHQLEC